MVATTGSKGRGEHAMTECPICRSENVFLFLSRERVPVHQNLVVSSRAAALEVPRGNLAMTACENCGFVFNAAFDETLLSYGAAYDNAQSYSPFFAAYLDRLVTDLVTKQGLRNCHVVEVGCGKGEFLRRLVKFPDSGIHATGFDPSYLGPDEDLDGRLRFVRAFYGPDTADIPADVVLCRHVIEHIADPTALLRVVRSTLRGSNPRVFFETPSVEWILSNQVVWDFFFEHCSLFSSESLRHAFQVSGFEVADISRVFGDQYFWIAAKVSEATKAIPTRSAVAALAEVFAQRSKRKLTLLGQRLRAMHYEGPIALWGAGAKGTALANLVDPDCSLIDCLVDLNPAKQGHFVPGSGHAIIGPKDLRGRNVRTVVPMNPNYRDEISRLIQVMNIACNLVMLE
jgi:SAM-dependent methyltransferase